MESFIRYIDPDIKQKDISEKKALIHISGSKLKENKGAEKTKKFFVNCFGLIAKIRFFVAKFTFMIYLLFRYSIIIFFQYSF